MPSGSLPTTPTRPTRYRSEPEALAPRSACATRGRNEKENQLSLPGQLESQLSTSEVGLCSPRAQGLAFEPGSYPRPSRPDGILAKHNWHCQLHTEVAVRQNENPGYVRVEHLLRLSRFRHTFRVDLKDG